MTYEITSKPQIQDEYSDNYETTMVIDLKREDGVDGDVWIVAGVPDYLRGSSDAARTQSGYTKVRVFGDSPSTWCPDSFGDDYQQIAVDVIAAVEAVALQAHRNRMDSLVAE